MGGFAVSMYRMETNLEMHDRVLVQWLECMRSVLEMWKRKRATKAPSIMFQICAAQLYLRASPRSMTRDPSRSSRIVALTSKLNCPEEHSPGLKFIARSINVRLFKVLSKLRIQSKPAKGKLEDAPSVPRTIPTLYMVSIQQNIIHNHRQQPQLPSAGGSVY